MKRVLIYVVLILLAVAGCWYYCHIPAITNDYYRFRLVDGRELVAKCPAGSKIANPVQIGHSYYYWASAVCNNENHFTDCVNFIVVK